MLSLALCLWSAGPAVAAAPQPPEDCEALYYGEGPTKDHVRALACYRKLEDWAMVAVMQLNGEGTPVDVAGARASLGKLEREGLDADGEALERILKRREANPHVKAGHVDFCADIAQTTPSLAYCASRQEASQTTKSDRRLGKLRARVETAARPSFDAAVVAFRSFVDAEGQRVYQKWIDGTIRGQASIAAESFARTNFMAEMESLATAGAGGPKRGPRSFADADRQLNLVYQGDISDDGSTAGEPDAAAQRAAAREYRTKARTAQRLWIHYRDAMAKLATTRWPKDPEVPGVIQALVTEDRLRELTPGEGDVR